MQFSRYFVVFLALFVASSCGSDVISLTEATLPSQIAEGSWMIEFFAPWCGHCKHLAPIWEQFATSVKPDISVASVDCTVQKNICAKFGIRGYPTIKFVKGDKVYDYSSARTLDAFTAFAKDGYNSASGKDLPDLPKEDKIEEPVPVVPISQVVILEDSNFDSNIQSGTWFVKFYAPWCGHCKNMAPTWDTLASLTQGNFKVAKIDCTVHKAACSSFNIRGYPTLKLIKDGKAYSYNGERSESGFLAFANGGYSTAESTALPARSGEAAPEPVKTTPPLSTQNTPPPQKQVVVLTQANFELYIANGEWLIEFYAPWCGHCKHLTPIWDELATKADVNIAKVDCTVEKDLMTRFGVRGFPTIKFISDGKVYDYKGARTVEAFLAFSNGGYTSAPAVTLAPQKDEL